MCYHEGMTENIRTQTLIMRGLSATEATEQARREALRDAMTAAAQAETRAVRAHLGAGEPADRRALDRAQARYRAARAAFEAQHG